MRITARHVWGRLRAAQKLVDPLSPANLFCYGQVESPYGSGDFIKELRRIVKDNENLILSEIAGKDAIYDSIRTFLGKGK